MSKKIKGLKITVQENDMGFNNFKQQMSDLDGSFMTMGFHRGEGKYEDGQLVSDIAAKNEYGTSRIPKRSFMRAWVDGNKSKIYKTIARIYKKANVSNMNSKRFLDLIGVWSVGEQKKFIVNLQNPPNSPITIKRKGSSNPLIDTGQMVNTVNHKTTIKKKVVRK